MCCVIAGVDGWMLSGRVYLKGDTGIDGELDVAIQGTGVHMTVNVTVPESGMIDFTMDIPQVSV